MGWITGHKKGAYIVTVNWEYGGSFPDPPSPWTDVTITVTDRGHTPKAQSNPYWWWYTNGWLFCDPNMAAYARVEGQGKQYTEDHNLQTAAASQNSLMKERDPADNSGTPLDMPAVAAAHTDQRIFDLLVPEGLFIGHYVRQGTRGGWVRVDRLMLPRGKQIPDTAVSHIQSFRAPEHLNALALLQPGGALVAFEYSPKTGNQKPLPVIAGGEPITKVNGAPALVQTDQGLFHLLVPLDDPNQIIHLVQSNVTIQNAWEHVATLPVLEGSSVVSIGLVQADGQGCLKAVVQLRPSEGPDYLKSYQSDRDFHWQGPFDLPVINPVGMPVPQPGETIGNVAGTPGLVQSIFGYKEQLDLLVPIVNVKTGQVTLTQFTQPAGIETSINRPWMLAASLQALNQDPQTQVVSASITQDSNRNLQIIAHVRTLDGQNLLAFYIFDPESGWSEPSLVTTPNGKPIVVGQNNEGAQDRPEGEVRTYGGRRHL